MISVAPRQDLQFLNGLWSRGPLTTGLDCLELWEELQRTTLDLEKTQIAGAHEAKPA